MFFSSTLKVVVENPVSRIHLGAQPLPAYQYFENARNFLIAMEELKLPTFEASDLERVSLRSNLLAQ